MKLKRPMCRKATDGKHPADWCATHNQPVWTCIKKYRADLLRVFELGEKKVEITKRIADIDRSLRLVWCKN